MISIIICTCNRGNSLKQTLISIGEMSVPSDISWELIVVDNNSTDATAEVIEEFARESGLNVRYVFERNQGLSHARNAGIKLTGDLTVHAIRKSYGQNLANHAPMNVVKEYMGHASIITTTEYYSTVTDDHANHARWIMQSFTSNKTDARLTPAAKNGRKRSVV